MDGPKNLATYDFFVSYTSLDKSWAEWISWVLEEHGYSTIVQAWDFRPGTNFAIEMQRATALAERTIAVLSPAYLESSFTEPEWAAAFADDPQGLSRKLVPVVVEPTHAPGLFGKIVHISLVGLEADAAAQALLEGVSPGRSKPVTAPAFPGGGESRVPAPLIAAPQLPQWRALSQPPPVRWHDEVVRPQPYSGSTLELHLLPLPPPRLGQRQLAELGAIMVCAGRARGLFTTDEAVGIDHTAEFAFAAAQRGRSGATTGIFVTRAGQRTVWTPLPSDGLGAVLDLDQLRDALPNLLALLGDLPLGEIPRVAFALRVSPILMLSVGDAAVVGKRSSANMAFATAARDAFQVDPEDDTTGDVMLPAAAELLADELIERLRIAARA